MSIPPLTGNALPLVGRERERAVLRQHLDAALAGHGSLVLVGGEAGIGKTALAEALCLEAEEHGALVLTGRCFDLTETPPYGLWLYLFARYHPSDSLPSLPALFAQPGVVGEVASRATLFTAVLDFFRAVSTHTPLVVLLDDLHWADPASLDLLRFLAQSVATLPMLLIVTYRSDELTRHHPLYTLLPILVRESQAARLDLHALASDDMRSVIAARYGLHETETVRLGTYLHERAEGNPFFVGELLRTLEEMGVMRERDGGWHLGDVTQVPVPTLLRQVIDGRLARLGEEAQDLLAVAAVIGQEVPLDVWAVVSAVEEDMLLAVIERGVESRLLMESSDGTRVRFAHALIREAIYEGILATRRRRMHRLIGEALAAASNANPDAVAYHFQQAGDARAATWLVRAGRRAQILFADRMTVVRFEAAVRLFEEHGGDERERGWALLYLGIGYRFIDLPRGIQCFAEALRVAERVGDRCLQTLVLAYRGWRLHDAGRMTAGLESILAATALASQLTDAERMTLSERGFEPRQTYQSGHLTEYLANLGRFTEARALGEPFAAAGRTDMAETAPNLSQHEAMNLGDCYKGLADSYHWQGEPERAAWAATRARSLYESIQWVMMLRALADLELRRVLTYETERVAERRRLAAESDTHTARWTQTLDTPIPRAGILPLLIVEGRWAEARAILEVVPKTLTGIYLLAPRVGIAPIDRIQGKVQAAWSVIDDILPDGPTREYDGPFRFHIEIVRLGACLSLDTGDLAAAEPWLRAYDDLLMRAETVIGLAEGQAMWAEYYRMRGDAEQAQRHAKRALHHADNPRQPLALLAAHRLLGELDTTAGRLAAARAHLNEALALADACAAPYERALTLLALAEVEAASSHLDAAMTLLTEARAICEPLGAKPALARADALAARVATASPPRPPTYPAGLSAREVDVLRLVATGLSNAEIAARLFLSERTIEQHLRSIYNKLGSSSRTAATRFAVEHHLT